MGMYNAVIDDEIPEPLGHLQGAASAKRALGRDVDGGRRGEVRRGTRWLDSPGMQFNFGKDDAIELTERQVREQLRMYIAASPAAP